MSRPKKHRYPFTLLSGRVCEVGGCETRIKVRLVVLRDARICYRHWIANERTRRGQGRP